MRDEGPAEILHRLFSYVEFLTGTDALYTRSGTAVDVPHTVHAPHVGSGRHRSRAAPVKE